MMTVTGTWCLAQNVSVARYITAHVTGKSCPIVPRDEARLRRFEAPARPVVGGGGRWNRRPHFMARRIKTHLMASSLVTYQHAPILFRIHMHIHTTTTHTPTPCLTTRTAPYACPPLEPTSFDPPSVLVAIRDSRLDLAVWASVVPGDSELPPIPLLAQHRLRHRPTSLEPRIRARTRIAGSPCRTTNSSRT